ncbi:MAG: alkaline phosphatase family protein [Deltaproteobacteria bacterium]|nr:MAG: alkaline phosphatase family protein [Deltaproteobacteria bacterium]
MRWLGLMVAVLTACPKKAPSPSDAGPPGLILVSIDGFHPSYLDLYSTPNLDLIAQGVRAEALIPPFPSMTFPSHYTLVTGLHPERHGIVSNTFYDPDRDQTFRLGDPASMTDGTWWGGEPVWNTAERQGLRAATLFWPGSEAEIQGMRPTWVTPYQHDLPHDARVDQVLDWLDLPPAERPHFMTLYFSAVDSAGHAWGPQSEQVGRAVSDVDQALGRLIEGLRARDLEGRIDLVVVSDHGMAAKDPERVVYPEEEGVDLTDIPIVEWSPLLGLNPPAERTAELLSQLAEVERLSCFPRESTPEAWRYRAHRAIPRVLCLADGGWQISRRSFAERHPERLSGGGHGWDPRWPPMHGIFLARGPRFALDHEVPPFEAVDVYAIVCAALGIDPAEHQGDGQLPATLLRP